MHVWSPESAILALVTTKRVPPGKMAATGNVLAGNAPNKDHISCGNDSCGHDTKGGDPTKRPTTIYDAVKSGFVAFFCIFIISFEVAIGIDRSFPKTSLSSVTDSPIRTSEVPSQLSSGGSLQYRSLDA